VSGRVHTVSMPKYACVYIHIKISLEWSEFERNLASRAWSNPNRGNVRLEVSILGRYSTRGGWDRNARNYNGRGYVAACLCFVPLEITLFVVLLSLYSRVEDYFYIFYDIGIIAPFTTTRASRSFSLVLRLVVSVSPTVNPLSSLVIHVAGYDARIILSLLVAYPSVANNRAIHSPGCSSWCIASPIFDIVGAASKRARFHDHEFFIVILQR